MQGNLPITWYIIIQYHMIIIWWFSARLPYLQCISLAPNQLTKDTPKLTLLGKLWSVFCVFWSKINQVIKRFDNIDGLVQDCSNSIIDTLESCVKSLIDICTTHVLCWCTMTNSHYYNTYQVTFSMLRMSIMSVDGTWFRLTLNIQVTTTVVLTLLTTCVSGAMTTIVTNHHTTSLRRRASPTGRNRYGQGPL